MTGDKISNFNDLEVLNKMVSLSRVSSLERTHSLPKIRNIICNDILNISDKKKFDDEYIKISFDNNNRMKFSCNKISLSSFFKFIYDNWKSGLITTRSIRKDKWDEFISEIKIRLLKSYDLENKLTSKQLEEIDESELTKKQLKDLILSNKSFNKNLLDKFKDALEIREQNNSLKETIYKKLEPLEGIR